MSSIDRRHFLKNSLLGVIAIAASTRQSSAAEPASPKVSDSNRQQAVGIVDTNVNLFNWPFRELKYRDTGALVSKLKKHHIVEAWAGSFEALFSKDLSGVNERLATECRNHGAGFLIPFGSVNLAWPDWEEDLRRCHEVHKMPGIRIYPGYQPFDLDHRDMESLVRMTWERGLILQIVFGMEDSRVYHPVLELGPVTFRPLLKALAATPNAKIQSLHFSGSPQGEDLSRFMALPNTSMDISRLEGNGALGRMIGSIEGLPSARVSADRLLFGSHAPYFPVETALLKLVESPLNSDQLRSVMQTNARRLLPRA